MLIAALRILAATGLGAAGGIIGGLFGVGGGVIVIPLLGMLYDLDQQVAQGTTLVMVVPTDLFERRVVASVAGLVGFGGAMGGLVMNLTAGRLLDLGFGYQTVFSIVGTLHVIAFVVILVAVPRIRPIASGDVAQDS